MRAGIFLEKCHFYMAIFIGIIPNCVYDRVCHDVSIISEIENNIFHLHHAAVAGNRSRPVTCGGA